MVGFSDLGAVIYSRWWHTNAEKMPIHDYAHT
jgi:hypothetical protein